jgi:hypothetical protein
MKGFTCLVQPSVVRETAPSMTFHGINGDEPRLAGERCTGLVLEHFFDGRQIEVNVVHLGIGDQWHRLYFEGSTVFWRVSARPGSAQNTEPARGLLLNDLSAVEGFVGHTVQGVEYHASEFGDVEVCIGFSSGRRLKLAYAAETDSAQVVD